MNIKSQRKLLLFLALALPLAAHAKDARDILETAQQKQLERWQGVNFYVVDQSVMGHNTQAFFQRVEVTDDGGETQTLFMPVAPDDLPEGSCSGPRRMTADELDAFASGMEMAGDGTAQGIEDGLEQAGLPRGLLAASGSDPNATFDPRVMMGGGASMMRSVAEHERAKAADPDRAHREATESANHMAQFYRTAELVGTEAVDGRQAYRLEASGMNHVQDMDGAQYRMHTVTMWMDAKEYVPLRMQIDGEVTQDGETRPMTIEQYQSDFREVPGSSLYEAYHRKMKISGMMDAAQQAQLQESQQQLAEMEKQMASMPANQRAMMEKMMGPQLEMIRNMASGGGFQTEIVVNAITVNPKTCGAALGARTVPTAFAPAAAAAAPAAASSKPAAGNLTAMVQADLTALGYDTGGTSGEMNTATIVAISKFQAENGMEVTGEVTPQLAGILSARVEGGGGAAAAASAPPAQSLQEAQQACLQEKMAAAQEAQQKKRGFGRLLSGVSRVAGRFGGADLARDMHQVTRDVYDVNATAADLSAAAKDLGLTEDDIEACRNPG